MLLKFFLFESIVGNFLTWLTFGTSVVLVSSTFMVDSFSVKFFRETFRRGIKSSSPDADHVSIKTKESALYSKLYFM